MCVAGTRWVQKEILEKHPRANIRVYAIWFNMFAGDERSKWPPDLLTDWRVIHRWDEGKVVGTWYGREKAKMIPLLAPDSNGEGGEILWDAYLLYDAKARWGDFPKGLIHWGRTIVSARETLRKDIEKLVR